MGIAVFAAMPVFSSSMELEHAFNRLAVVREEIDRLYQSSGIAALEVEAAALEKIIKTVTLQTKAKQHGAGFVCQVQHSFECKGEQCANLTAFAALRPALNRELIASYHQTQYIESKALRAALAMFPEYREQMRQFITTKAAVVLRKGTLREAPDDEEDVPF